MFKAGEKVIHHRFGEGMLASTESNDYPLVFLNPKVEVYLKLDGRLEEDDLYPSIYYVPQTLDMSKPEPEIGTWGYFWDREIDRIVFGKLGYVQEAIPKYLLSGAGYMKFFSPEIPPHIKELMNGNSTSNT